MNTRLIVPMILGAVMLTTPVHATVKTEMLPSQKCIILENQFDTAIKSHEHAAKVNEAKTMRTEGGNLCTSGNYDDGVAKLEHALRDLGVKAKG